MEDFVAHSKNINNVSYKTRDAHVTSYSTLKGRYIAYDNFEERSVFPLKDLNCIIRISNAHMKLVSQKKAIPAYGFSVKISNDEQTILNLPLVNFPLFPINHISRFLKLFTAVNYFFSRSLLRKFPQAIKILKNVIVLLPGLFNPSFVRETLKLVRKRNNFILSFDYHSIGAYRLGNHIVKYKLAPIGVPVKCDQNRIDCAIKDYVLDYNYELELMVQYCYNLKDQPVNQLNKNWKNSDFVPIGRIQISQLIDKDDVSVEKMSFNPFESSEGLQPVGKIQRLRDQAYKASFKIRNE